MHTSNKQVLPMNLGDTESPAFHAMELLGKTSPEQFTELMIILCAHFFTDSGSMSAAQAKETLDLFHEALQDKFNDFYPTSTIH